MVFRSIEDQKIFQEIFVSSVFIADAGLNVHTEGAEELLILGTVIIHHLHQLGFDLLFQAVSDYVKLTGMLKNLTGDVQRQVRRIDNALDEVKVLVNEIRAFFHDHNAVGIQCDSGFLVF